MTTQVAWDDDFIGTCLLRGEAPKPLLGSMVPLGNCRWCTHPEHGLPCRTTTCLCENTFSSRDDSWRPADIGFSTDAMRVRHFAQLHGLDGWVARIAATSQTPRIGSHARRVRDLLEASFDNSTPTTQQGAPS